MTASDIVNGSQKALVEAASLVAEKIKENAHSNNLPSAISNATSIDAPKSDGNNSSIDIKISLSQAPMAAAFEWGSGVHATRGEAKLYPIPGKPFLAIPRERWPNYQPPPDVDPVVLRKVMHPGVASRPYIVPAMQDTKAQVFEILGKEFKASILLGTEKITVIG